MKKKSKTSFTKIPLYCVLLTLLLIVIVLLIIWSKKCPKENFDFLQKYKIDCAARHLAFSNGLVYKDASNAGSWVFIPTDKTGVFVLKNTDSGFVMTLNSRRVPILVSESSVPTTYDKTNLGYWEIVSTSSGFLLRNVNTNLFLFGSTPISVAACGTSISSNCLWNLTPK